MTTLLCSFLLFMSAGAFATTAHDSFSMAQVTNVPYPSGLVAARQGNRIALLHGAVASRALIRMIVVGG
ncbi:MAG: hypothetical protein ABI178_12970 [Rhodanobacter sp.]